MTIGIRFQAVAEDQPGAQWQALFARSWPGYRAWFLRSGTVGRPTYLECRRALRQHMPELVPTWERLVELAGGGDLEARFLSLWRPPAYIAGCSQAVWPDAGDAQGPALLRNYDYAPALLEGNWLATRWTGQRVLAMSDCLWGALDGLNASGLAASLSFGGRTIAGEGFGIPLVLRYVLEVATDTASAIAILQRVPVHMCYSVTLLDARGAWATVFLNPDRPVEVTRRAAVTNFQHAVEWPEHARATAACERLDALQALAGAGAPVQAAVDALLREPLYQPAWERGYGTLYTAAYAPRAGRVQLLWPGTCWTQTLDAFEEGEREITFLSPAP
ncbi:C45 family autoproteolytic acyltransferase/hydolase [Pseudorhodoferax sp.]|uniref:C45 family autoproteolytic acyltransferase/hydolase n=1 Tax=Pseudorhodoferax sp. TaxID=1993553 RepID=UPI0039E67D6D